MDLFAVSKLQELELFCSIAWNIWAHRNIVVWDHRHQSPLRVVNEASTILFQWQQAQVKQKRNCSINNREGVAVWQKPSPGWKSRNVDAVVSINSGHSSFGCILRDEQGSFIAGYGGNLMGIVDPRTAEAMAFREVLSWLKRLHISQVFIELDSLGVVQAFHSNLSDDSYFGSIVKDCSDIAKDLRSYLVYFIRRSANSTAHYVAREASFLSDRKEWFSAPSFLIDVISQDLQ